MDFAEKLVEALNVKFPVTNSWDTAFAIIDGRKYTKIVRNNGVYCFVDADGNVYKAESWSKPAKGVRATLATPEEFAAAVERADRSGGWLYAGANR